MKLRLAVSCYILVVISSRGEAASFTGLGMLPNGFVLDGDGLAISQNGNTVVGSAFRQGFGTQVFRWTAPSGFRLIGDLPGGEISGSADAVSNNGAIVGSGRMLSSGGQSIRKEARWTESTEWQTLSPSDVSGSYASDLSADGAVVVGRDFIGGRRTQAFRWTETTGMVSLGDLPNGNARSSANAISADGSVIVGSAEIADFVQEAFRWTAETGMVGLGDLPGGAFGSTATDISANGLVIVGTSTVADDPPRDTGFRWTQETGMVRIDKPANDSIPFSEFRPAAVSGDGSIIVGGPHIWDSVNGTRFLRDVFVHDYGFAHDLAGWTGVYARGISADGRVILGSGVNPNGINELWIAHLDESMSPPRPPGNYNGDLRVDAADYVVWRKGLGSTHTEADYNVWKSNFATQRLVGVVGTPVTSAQLSPNNELQSFIVGGKKYTQDDLIQPTLTGFTGNTAAVENILVPVGNPVPDPGNRSELLTHDFRLDTGIADPGLGPTRATLSFTPPLVNGPGPDLVVFQLDNETNVFQLQINSNVGALLENASREQVTTVDLDLYKRTAGVPNSIVQLENDEFSKTATVPDFPVVGLTIDLDELGVSPFGEVSTIQFGTLAAQPYFLPMLIMGIRSAPATSGDFNKDRIVDAADYIVWRNGLGAQYTQADYDVWRAHFGQTVGNGSSFATVPEPTTAVLGLLAVVWAAGEAVRFRPLRRRRGLGSW
jgi:probable HAF family extracellular repeat protein